ncbi:MAG: hypothetical protein JWM28_2239 [Chitinophagaceae bacterium]|nr:hypothetical protein [Chitinophagaceae bacterium]
MRFDFADQIRQKTDNELNDIFINAGDYNPEFVRLAEEELKIRNIDMDTSKQVKEKIVQTEKIHLSEGKAGSPLYIFLCFVLALLGGFLGIYAGYIYSQSKTKTNEGEEFYVYNENTRQLGTTMMWLGIAVFVFFLLRRIITS